MKTYDYAKAVKNDVLDFIIDNEIAINESNREEIAEELNEVLWTCDSVTGNASGSYTFNTFLAEEYLCHNLHLLAASAKEYGCDCCKLLECPEHADITIRCYLLHSAIEEAINEILEEEEKEEVLQTA